jgi:hypothetical protein
MTPPCVFSSTHSRKEQTETEERFMYINVYLFISKKVSTERPASFSQWGPKACSRGHGQESWIESKADSFGLAEGLAAS